MLERTFVRDVTNNVTALVMDLARVIVSNVNMYVMVLIVFKNVLHQSILTTVHAKIVMKIAFPAVQDR